MTGLDHEALVSQGKRDPGGTSAGSPQSRTVYRTGRHLGRTIYRQVSRTLGTDELIGVMDTRELGELVVEALNDHEALVSQGKRDPGGTSRQSPQSKMVYRNERLIYQGKDMVGVMDTPEDADLVVEALNDRECFLAVERRPIR